MNANAAFERAVQELAKKVNITYTAARSRILRARRIKEEGVPHFTCPKCGVTSTHPKDVAESYCFVCHGWTREKQA